MKEKLIGKKTGICEKCGKFVDVDVVQVDKAIQSTYHDFYALGNGSNWGVYI